MGKHRNQIQNRLFIEFMENNPDIAKGFTKRDKFVVDSLWQQLAESLNAAGPPHKNVNAWKKIWTEWKSEIKKKLSHNKNEAQATGGGPFSQLHLSQTEETIVRLCGIKTTVDGISKVDLDVVDDPCPDFNDTTTISFKRKPESPINFNTPKRTRADSTADRLKRFLEDVEQKAEVNEKLDQLVTLQKENACSLRRIYHAIEKGNDCQQSMTNALQDFKNEFASVSSRMLNIMQEKNEIKKKQLELDIMKLKSRLVHSVL